MPAPLSKLSIATPTILVIALLETAHAQIATDGTVGPRVEFDGPEFAIGADLGRQAGRNLFHSFERFSLGTGERATFSGPDQIRNVISRVTGGERSDIDGTLRSTIPGADFYFINPAGILFGPNASLDLQGSFHVSTADEVRFRDGATFSADLDARSSFTVAAPEAFGFLGGDRGNLSVADSRLQVLPGEAISLVGGEVTIEGGGAESGATTIGASRGTITVGAVGVEGGQVAIRSGRLETAERAPITITNGAVLDTTGDGAGAIRIRGGAVVIEGNSSMIANNVGQTPAMAGIDVQAEAVSILGDSQVRAEASGSGAGADVSINASEVRIRGSIILSESIGSGAGGDVSITAGDIRIKVFTFISSDTTSGAGGSIRIEGGRVVIAGRITETTSETSFEFSSIGSGTVDGDAGAVIITAEELIIRDSAAVGSGTSGTGKGGAVIITAEDLTLRNFSSIRSESFGTGDAGSVTIDAEKFLNQDSSISSRTFDERGASGQITINANDSTIDGGDVNSGTLGPGTAGSISIVADRMILKNQGSIGSSWEFIAFADPRGERDRIATGVPIDRSDVEKIIGIDIEFIEEELVIDYQYFLSPDGRVFVIDVFQGDLTLMLLPLGAGDAGDVFVSVKNLTIDGGFVQTESAASGGGRIVIEATDLIDLVGADVNSNGLLPEEGDSVISLRAPRIAVSASRVTSLTRDGEPLLGSGEARILGEATAISADSEVAASSTVEIRGQETDLGSQLIALEGTVVDTAPLRERCSVRRDVGASSFTNVGRGGLPPSPDAPLRSAYSGAPAVPAAAQPSMLHVAGCAGAP